uniref:Secreted protein n=1 Tax=Mesocestoides corti TaxID=53468 RepID=A0A5K3FRU1_MESCO
STALHFPWCFIFAISEICTKHTRSWLLLLLIGLSPMNSARGREHDHLPPFAAYKSAHT